MEDIIHDLFVSCYRVMTDGVESDGTLEWNSTSLVLVEIQAAGRTGIGYTYGDPSIAGFIDKTLKTAVIGRHPLDIGGTVRAISALLRNEGHCGMAWMALSALDTALWDLKAKLLDLPLCRLLGMAREKVPIYGSGGFTSYSEDRLSRQLGEWAGQGFTAVKMKIGSDPVCDPQRVRTARAAIGEDVELYVDANGAFSARKALAMAQKFADCGVTWLEEPVSSDDLTGLRFIREHGPIAMRIAAGEYGYAPEYFLRMLRSGAVDVLQADATRCGGITGFLRAGQLCEAFGLPFSFHCAPALHLHAALCVPSFLIGEYFHDHVRIEQMLFDGTPGADKGALRPDLSRPGLGLEFRHKDAKKYRIV